jgi:hypothetical protein
LLYYVEKSYVHAGMPGKSYSCIGIFTDSPAAGFRHQGHSGTDDRELVWHCPAEFKTYIMLKAMEGKGRSEGRHYTF